MAKARKQRERASASPGQARKRKALDPVTLEVIRNALPAVANEMAADLQRTSYNMMIYEVRDFCTALIDPDGKLVSQNVGGVSHFVADLGVIIVDGMKRYGAKGFKPGDVVITNHQAVAGQHLNNVVIYAPYFYKGELLMFMMVRAHWIDVGGMSTGFGAGPTVADPWLEGLQLDQLKIYEGGKLNDTLYRVLKDNIRFPESSLGDMKSQMAACRLAAKRMDELFDKYGRETILAAIETIFDETERKCRNVVAQLPDGVYEAESAIDDDGVRKGEPVPIQRQGHDQERRDDHRPLRLLGRAQVGRQLAHARRRARRLQGADRPERSGQRRLVPRAQRHHPGRQRHDGALSRADVVVEHHDPDGGRHHRQGAGEADARPRAGRTSRPARRRGGVLRRASEDQAPLRGAEHRRRRLGRPSLRGRRVRHRLGLPGRRAQRLDRRHRAEMPGAGGRPRAAHAIPPAPASIAAGSASTCRCSNLVEGRWNFEQTRRSVCPPWGLWGGGDGDPSAYLLRLPGENDFKMMVGAHIPVPLHASAIVRTGGGGGWGDPLERDPELVRADVMEELVSREAAREKYGVVLRDDLSIDEEATKKAARARA